MTDKVRIDTLRADLLDANNETFLARQAEFESNVRSYPRKLPLAITKAEGVWLTDADNKQYRTASRAPVLSLWATTTLMYCRASKCHYQRLAVTYSRSYHPVKRSLLRIPALLPAGRRKEYCLQFTGPSGADAVEAALKLAKNTPVVPR